MYIRYIYKLCHLHVACENFTEAGFALLMHAYLLDVSLLDHDRFSCTSSLLNKPFVSVCNSNIEY